MEKKFKKPKDKKAIWKYELEHHNETLHFQYDCYLPISYSKYELISIYF